MFQIRCNPFLDDRRQVGKPFPSPCRLRVSTFHRTFGSKAENFQWSTEKQFLKIPFRKLFKFSCLQQS